MPNLDNTLWMGNLRLRQKKLEQKRAEKQAAQQIAAQGASNTQNLLERGFRQGLQSAEKAAKVAAMRGEGSPMHSNPRMQEAADSGYTTQRYLQGQKQQEFDAKKNAQGMKSLLELYKYSGDSNFREAKKKQELAIANTSNSLRDKISKRANQTRRDVASMAAVNAGKTRENQEAKEARAIKGENISRLAKLGRILGGFERHGQPLTFEQMETRDPTRAANAQMIASQMDPPVNIRKAGAMAYLEEEIQKAGGGGQPPIVFGQGPEGTGIPSPPQAPAGFGGVDPGGESLFNATKRRVPGRAFPLGEI